MTSRMVTRAMRMAKGSAAKKGGKDPSNNNKKKTKRSRGRRTTWHRQGSPLLKGRGLVAGQLQRSRWFRVGNYMLLTMWGLYSDTNH